MVLPIILLIGTAVATGSIILASALGLILAVPTAEAIMWSRRIDEEKTTLETIENEKKETLEKTKAFQLMQDAIGGTAAFNQLPVLDIGRRRGSTDYIDFLRPQDLTHSVMRGVDSLQRPFICLKVRSKRPQNQDQEFVVTLFQRYTSGPLSHNWTYGTTHIGELTEIFGFRIQDRHHAAIRQIVVEKNHPDLALI